MGRMWRGLAAADGPTGGEAVGPCLNCGTPLMGVYCHQCGQPADTRPITWRSLRFDHYRAFWRLDSEIGRTARALVTDPGGFCREYVQGRRRGRTAPVTYFLTSFFVSFLLLSADRWLFHDSRAAQGSATPLESQLGVLGAAFVWAIAQRLVFRRSGFTAPELAVCTLYLFGQLNLVSAAMLFATGPIHEFWPGARSLLAGVALAAVFWYLTHFTSRLHRLSMRRSLAGTLAVTVVFLLISVPCLMAWAVARASWLRF